MLAIWNGCLQIDIFTAVTAPLINATAGLCSNSTSHFRGLNPDDVWLVFVSSQNSKDHRLLLYESLVLTPTATAHSEYQRVGVLSEPNHKKNYLEQAIFVTSGDEIRTPRNL